MRRGIVCASQADADAIDARLMLLRGGVRCLRVSGELSGAASLICLCTAAEVSADCLWVERRVADAVLSDTDEIVYPVVDEQQETRLTPAERARARAYRRRERLT